MASTRLLSIDEEQRLAALASLELMDTPAEERFDRLCRLAQDLVGVPISYVSLINHDRQWFKASCGIDGISEIPREGSICDTEGVPGGVEFEDHVPARWSWPISSEVLQTC